MKITPEMFGLTAADVAKFEKQDEQLATLRKDMLISQGCFLSVRLIGYPDQRIPVSSLAEASRAWQKIRDTYGVGGRDEKRGNGNIYGADKKTVIAKISYNGRAWDVNGELLEEAA